MIDQISHFFCPSPEELADRGAKELKHVVESVNVIWDSCDLLLDPRPQPDYSVAVSRLACIDDQFEEPISFLGEVIDSSTFMATHKMLFPIFACEVNCAAASLDVADRQNAARTWLAVRDLLDLIDLSGCEQELDRKIIAYSVWHDHRMVHIYSCYMRNQA